MAKMCCPHTVGSSAHTKGLSTLSYCPLYEWKSPPYRAANTHTLPHDSMPSKQTSRFLGGLHTMGVITQQGVGFSLNKKLHIHSEVGFCSREKESHSSRGTLRSVKVTQPLCSITSNEVLLVSFTYANCIARWEIVLYVQVSLTSLISPSSPHS
jgi:hypothetical protein